jgi:hypothetical protein
MNLSMRTGYNYYVMEESDVPMSTCRAMGKRDVLTSKTRKDIDASCYMHENDSGHKKVHK